MSADDVEPVPVSADLFPISELPRHLPMRGGRPVSLPTAYRAITRGWRGIVLQSWVISGRRYTTDAAVRDFIRRCTAASALAPPVPSARSRSPRNCKRRSPSPESLKTLRSAGFDV